MRISDWSSDVCSSDLAQDAPPNVVIIFMEDMGYGDLGCYGGGPYETPHLNKLTAEGMRFTHFYAAQAVCSASRAALITGCYLNRIGITVALLPGIAFVLNHEAATRAELRKEAGYTQGRAG